jgi:hypothetical protein
VQSLCPAGPGLQMGQRISVKAAHVDTCHQ